MPLHGLSFEVPRLITDTLQSANKPRVERHQTVYHLLLGLSHEFGISPQMTIQLSGPLSAGFTYHYRSNYNVISERTVEEEAFYWTIRPSLTGTFRYYYNLNKRHQKGRRTDRNSGNFIGLETNFYGPPVIEKSVPGTTRFATTIGPIWGIQRTYGKRFNLQVSTGPGLGIDHNSMYLTFVGGVSVGFRLGKH